MKPSRLNDYDIQQMRMTMTNQEIADHYGITRNYLYVYCRKRCITVFRVTDWEVAEGIGTKTVKELAYEYNVTESTIRHRLSKLGLSARQPGQAGGRK